MDRMNRTDQPASRSWAFGTASRSPFSHPSGFRGRLAGLVMLLTNDHQGVVDLLAVRPGDRVLEIGHGAGGFLRRLVATPAGTIYGVEPSEVMRDEAARRLRNEIASGRVELRLGTAADTGLPAASVDRVVALNNVAIWPDLEDGLREIHRITRPDGLVVIGWHSRTAPSRFTRRLALPEDRLEVLHDTMRWVFGAAERVELRSLTAFTATR